MLFNDTKQKFLIGQTRHLAPMGQMQRELYSPKLNETEWLIKTIASLGGTPVGKKSDMWKQLNSLESNPVGKTVSENQKIYYLVHS